MVVLVGLLLVEFVLLVGGGGDSGKGSDDTFS